MEICLPL
ncbi:Unknown (protein for MGC:72974), isoform CRA_c, partial [Rattus norvegicus]